MPIKPVDPAIRELAVHLVLQEGRSFRDVGEELGISHTTVKRFVTAAEAAGATRAPRRASAPPAEPPTEAELEASGVETLPRLRQLLEQFMRSSEAAAAEGRPREAAALAGHVTRLAPVIARLETAQNDNPDAIAFTRAEIDAMRAQIRERVGSMNERPMLCAHCMRALHVQWAGVTPPEET